MGGSGTGRSHTYEYDVRQEMFPYMRAAVFDGYTSSARVVVGQYCREMPACEVSGLCSSWNMMHGALAQITALDR